MIEPFFVLAFLAIVLGLVMLVGHGLWVLLATLLGSGSGQSPQKKDCARCSFCGRLVAAEAERCHWCHHPMRSPLAGELADIEAVQRQLRRLEEAGYLKAQTAARLASRLARYREERLSPPTPPQTAPDVSPPPAPVPTLPAAPSTTRPPEVAAAWAQVVEAEVVPEPPSSLADAGFSPSERPASPSEPPEAAGAARPWQEALAGFLADREIHWAELIGVLVGGFIMVGSSVALVVNLWQTLEHTPYLKFFVFVAYTSVVFAAGLYAFYRWKLRSTGGGLLVIGMLLVPLNFLAMASLWRAGLGPGAIAAEAAALAIFVVLIRLAAGVLTPAGRWFAPLAIAGNSAALLGVARFVHASQPHWFLAVAACVPVVVFATSMGGYLLRAVRKPDLREPDVVALLILLGTAGFALCVAIGLCVTQVTAVLGSLAAALNLLAVPASLAAVPILAVGVRVMRTVGPEALDAAAVTPADSSGFVADGVAGPGNGSFAAAGTLVALLAVLLQIAALGLAWPDPSTVVAVGLFNAAGLLLVAFRHDFPAAHVGAMACLALSYLVGFHWAIGNLEGIAAAVLGTRMLQLAVAAQSGTALGGLFAAFALASVLLKRLPERRHGEVYAAGSAVVAVLGLMLVTYHGLSAAGADAYRAAALYSLYGAGSLALAALWRDRRFAHLGMPLVAAAPLWALWASTGQLAPVAATLLAGEALAAGLLAFVLRKKPAVDRQLAPAHQSEDAAPYEAVPEQGNAVGALSLSGVFHRPLVHVAEVLAALAATLWVVTAWTHRATIDGVLPPVATVAILAVFYIAGAWVDGARWRVWTGSMVVLAGLVHTLTMNFTGIVEHPWLIAPLAHATAGLIAALAMDWGGQRQTRGRRRRLRAFADPLADTALLSSMLPLPILPFIWQTNWVFAGGLFWPAAIWLVFAVRNGNRLVFGAHQALLGVAAVVATTVWLRAFLPNLADQWFTPACLHVYGIALACVMLPWPLLRSLSRRLSVAEKPAGSSAGSGAPRVQHRQSLLGNWQHLLALYPGVDHVLRHALVIVQFLVASLWLVPELARELGLPAGSMVDGVQDVGAYGAWLVVALLSAGLLIELWQRWGRAELLSALVLAGTVPWLLAGRALDHVAVASALRWTASGLFLGASALVWWRDGLTRLTTAGGIRWHSAERSTPQPAFMPPDRVARAAILAFGLLPAIALTIVAAALRLDYVTPRGPLVDSVFFAMGPYVNQLVPLVLLTMALVGCALRERSAAYALGSVLLANLAGLVAWQAWGPSGWHGLLLAQVFAMAGTAAFWTAVKLFLPGRTPPLTLGDLELAPNHLAAQAAVGLVLLLVAASALGIFTGEYRMIIGQFDALALLAAAAAITFCLWDRTARFPIAALYLLGLAAVGLALGYRDFGARQYVWTSAPELAGFVIGAGFLGWLFSLLQAKSLADPADGTLRGGYAGVLHTVVVRLMIAASRPRYWFHTCQAFLGVIAAALALWVSFDVSNDGVGADTALFGLAGRWAGPPAALMLLGAAITMAWQSIGEHRRAWQMAAFGAGFLLNLTIGLAALDATPGTPVGNALWLNRLAVLLTGAAMLTLLSRFGLRGVLPQAGDWLHVGRDVAPVFASITTVALPLLLMSEFLAFEPAAGAPVAAFSVIAIPVLLVPLAAACLMHAIRTARAAGSPELAGRFGFVQSPQPAPTLFVYAAEAIVALAALHLWLCEPQWFRLGLIEQYWMFLVMAVAFAGVGISEWFHRAGVPVLSEPLGNTAAALPILPMAGFWFMAPPDSLLGLTGSTPALWLLMALFYGYLATTKPTSVLFGLLTLLTGSVGLWVLLDRQQLDFFTHPQLWLIPPALAMLVAERLNRPRFGDRQREVLRYVALSVIYVASTTEFMRGIGESIWLPLVLLGLSVAGVLLGVALKIRSYIYLGMTFLAVVIVRMIVYAAFEHGQMWLFWVCCILLGAAIIVLFAAFERRRNDIAAAVEKFRQWER
ncbi:MAG: hypothetical protein RBS80_09500 [Thermoguttaceae bacterium]|nr:hypothetical protein [Thermoguttaceae bacterium]